MIYIRVVEVGALCIGRSWILHVWRNSAYTQALTRDSEMAVQRISLSASIGIVTSADYSVIVA